MIVSASRRTDIPALYAPWLLRRLAEGYAEVPHPFAPSRVRRVDLRLPPEGPLEALVLWTRNPAPLLPSIPRWEASGPPTLWLVTVIGYPRPLEGGPPGDIAVRAAKALADAVGPDRVVWRYDPLLTCPALGVTERWHEGNFVRLADALAGSTRRCVVSGYDDYAKARRRLARVGLPLGPSEALAQLAATLARIAAARGIRLQTCCEAWQAAGVPAGACIDGELLDRLWGLGVAGQRDPGQRPGCRCAPAVDLGVYDTCTHGCLYCYATGSGARAAAHDPAGPRLA
ncbi:MAG: DUF1848 domain-containing protein [Deferrisomatales bacterium]